MEPVSKEEFLLKLEQARKCRTGLESLCLHDADISGADFSGLDCQWWDMKNVRPAGAMLRPFATRHRVPSVGYRLELPRAGRFDPAQARALGVPVQQWKLLQQGQSVLVKGRTVAPAEVLGASRRGLSMVFSGDTAPCAALEQAAQGADLLICDATYALPEQEAQAAQWGHSTFGQSAALAARAGAHRLWLTHYSPMITDPEADLPRAQSIFPAAVCGADGMQITLQYEEA